MIRTYVIAGVCTAVAAVAAFSVFAPPDPGIFDIRATHQDGQIHITYEDVSGGTTYAAVEILGMAQTFRQTYEEAEFALAVPFVGEPRYGWGAHPIIIDVQHQELGHIRIKTEIRNAGEPAAPLLFER